MTWFSCDPWVFHRPSTTKYWKMMSSMNFVCQSESFKLIPTLDSKIWHAPWFSPWNWVCQFCRTWKMKLFNFETFVTKICSLGQSFISEHLSLLQLQSAWRVNRGIREYSIIISQCLIHLIRKTKKTTWQQPLWCEEESVIQVKGKDFHEKNYTSHEHFPSFSAIKHKHFENHSTQPHPWFCNMWTLLYIKMRNNLHLVWSPVHLITKSKFKNNILFDLFNLFNFIQFDSNFEFWLRCKTIFIMMKLLIGTVSIPFDVLNPKHK